MSERVLAILHPSAEINREDRFEPEGARLMFQCPGCECCHFVYVKPVGQKPCWGWNGSMERPTFEPSILVRGGNIGGLYDGVCHSYVRDGNIQFLGDCTHKLAGQTVPLQPW